MNCPFDAISTLSFSLNFFFPMSAPFAIQEGFKLLEKVAVIPRAMSDNQYRAFDFHLRLARAINA